MASSMIWQKSLGGPFAQQDDDPAYKRGNQEGVAEERQRRRRGQHLLAPENPRGGDQEQSRGEDADPAYPDRKLSWHANEQQCRRPERNARAERGDARTWPRRRAGENDALTNAEYKKASSDDIVSHVVEFQR